MINILPCYDVLIINNYYFFIATILQYTSCRIVFNFNLCNMTCVEGVE